MRQFVVYGHDCHTALKVCVKAAENQAKLPRLYRILNAIINTKACFIVNSILIRQTEPYKLLTSCLTAIENMTFSSVIQYMKDQVGIYLVEYHLIAIFSLVFFPP